MSENFGYKLGKFIKNNFSASTQKVVSAGVDSLEKRLNKPVMSRHKNHTKFDKNSKTTTICDEAVKVYNLDGQHPYYGYNE
ncbi:hypothetical protein [Gallibacterium sp. AGMB14963]|uniref:hypothetical protein n=1 Tax=Gallibacterium faecale TaxID=3019086 RepID=UPI0022F15C75|nr:hypothetical protein [Gallibacterium sp. AGMB14963]MDA3978095.1 hypothetical protein [Gallibacterium sp. AGMB14963]